MTKKGNNIIKRIVVKRVVEKTLIGLKHNLYTFLIQES